MAENVTGQEKPSLPFEKIPIVGKQVKDLVSKADVAAGAEGFSKGIRTVLDEKGANIAVKYDSQTTAEYIHQTGHPLIVITTHSSVAEPLAVLASLSLGVNMPRDDIRAMVADGFIQYPNLNTYFLPLYNTVPKGVFHPKSLGGGEHIDSRRAASVNHRNLDIATSELRDGKLIFICPEGQLSKDAPWYSAGIGRLVANAGKENNGHIIFADAKGASKIELAKIVNPLAVPKPFQHVIVRFSQPLSITEIIEANGNNKAAIATHLRNQYNEWLK